MQKMELINDTRRPARKWAQEQPDQYFLVIRTGICVSALRQFNERVDTLKGSARNRVTSSAKVGVWAKNVPDWLTFMFASARIGAVTVNTNYKAAELKYIMQDADIHDVPRERLPRQRPRTDHVRSGTRTALVERGRLHSDEFPELRNVVCIGQEKQRGMATTAERVTMGSYASDEALLAAKAQVNPFEEVNMQYFGTTGFPKG